MAFSVTATPDTVTLGEGETVDVTYTFIDVPADVTGEATETIALGVLQVVATISLTLVAPSPISQSFTVPADVTRELISIDDTQAVIRYSR